MIVEIVKGAAFLAFTAAFIWLWLRKRKADKEERLERKNFKNENFKDLLK